ncbi:MAG: PAS domain-containing protein [Elusimicrobia bacterium]|nr:PAS domain-containing protein [Elusimicrobiota bacterium]
MLKFFRQRTPVVLPEKPSPSPFTFLKNLVNSLTDGVLAVDGNRRILLANPAVSTLLNQPSTEAIGKPVWEVLRHRELGELLDRVFQSGQGEGKELSFGPEPRLYDVRASPLPEGNEAGVVLTFHDVTPLRRLENLRKDFVANVSHELKTPLTALRAALETLLDGALEDPKHARDFLQTAQDQTERLQRLIEDLLTLSRLEHPNAPQTPASCILQEVSQRVIKALNPIAKKDQILFTTQFPTSPLVVALNADELTQILFNLLDNAIKFNRNDGRVTLRGNQTGDQTVIEVEDTGVGIPPEDQSRVFERFYRVDKARTRERGGTGLGLAIVKHLIENRGGTVAVSSAPDKGTTFTIHLPSANRARSPFHP